MNIWTLVLQLFVREKSETPPPDPSRIMRLAVETMKDVLSDKNLKKLGQARGLIFERDRTQLETDEGVAMFIEALSEIAQAYGITLEVQLDNHPPKTLIVDFFKHPQPPSAA